MKDYYFIESIMNTLCVKCYSNLLMTILVNRVMKLYNHVTRLYILQGFVIHVTRLYILQGFAIQVTRLDMLQS